NYHPRVTGSGAILIRSRQDLLYICLVNIVIVDVRKSSRLIDYRTGFSRLQNRKSAVTLQAKSEVSGVIKPSMFREPTSPALSHEPHSCRSPDSVILHDRCSAGDRIESSNSRAAIP